jgi:hypothetical protein
MLCLLTCAACTDFPPRPDAGPHYPGPPVLELGNAAAGDPHHAVAEGQPVRVIAGLQGGFHIWGSLHVENMDTGHLTLRSQLSTPVEVLGDITRGGVHFSQVGAYAHEAVGLTLLFDDGKNPRSWDGGVPVLVRATVQDSSGRTAVAERTWMATCCDGQP